MLMLEDGDDIREPGDSDEEDIDWEKMCPQFLIKWLLIKIIRCC